MFNEIASRETYRRGYAVTTETIVQSAPQPIAIHPPLSLEEILTRFFKLLDQPGVTPLFLGESHSSFAARDDHDEIILNPYDSILARELEERLTKRRDLKSYLLWLTVCPDYLKWDRLFVLLHVDLSLEYNEVNNSEQGPVHKDIDITQAMEHYPCFVLGGRPGSGKTTTLQKIALDQARKVLSGKPERIPLYERLVLQQGRPADSFLAETWDRYTNTSFDDAFAAGRLLLLLDGINEMASEGKQDRLRAWAAFVQKAVQRGNRVIFSVRELDYVNQLGLTQVNVKPLENEQIRDYLVRREAEGLWKLIVDPRNRLGELAATPFFLNLLVDDYLGGERFLANRGRMMERLADKCLKREITNFGEGLLPRDCRERAMAVLAYEMQKIGTGTIIDLAEARGFLPAQVETREGEELRVEPFEFFRYARGATILDPDRYFLEKTKKIRFFHHLLQEYFAARELVRRFDEGEDLSESWRAQLLISEMHAEEVKEGVPLPPPPSTDWEETTVFAVGLIKDPVKLIAAVRAVNPVLAGRCLDEAGLEAIYTLRLGGLQIGLETEDRELAEELAACRRALLQELYEPQVDLRARIPAGLTLGRLGDPRLVLHEKVGVRFIYPDLVPVPAGSYTIGNRDDDQEAERDKMPALKIDLPAFNIGKRPVTNAEYACFMEAGGYQDERWWQTELDRQWLKGEEVAGGQIKTAIENWQFLKKQPDWEQYLKNKKLPSEVIEVWRPFLKHDKEDELLAYLHKILPQKSRQRPYLWDDGRFNRPNQPVVGVTWFEAQAYYAWLSAVAGAECRLPNEFEWEAAARGAERRPFAFGEWDAQKANIIEGRVMRTTPVGCYAAVGGRGPHGEEDQTGNTWEWTRSLYIDYGHQEADREDPSASGYRVLRGGSWVDSRRFARCAFRNGCVPDLFSSIVGFRLLSHDFLSSRQ